MLYFGGTSTTKRSSLYCQLVTESSLKNKKNKKCRSVFNTFLPCEYYAFKTIQIVYANLKHP